VSKPRARKRPANTPEDDARTTERLLARVLEELREEVEKLQHRLNEVAGALAQQYSGGLPELAKTAQRLAVADIVKRCPTPALRATVRALLPKPKGAPVKVAAPTPNRRFELWNGNERREVLPDRPEDRYLAAALSKRMKPTEKALAAPGLLLLYDIFTRKRPGATEKQFCEWALQFPDYSHLRDPEAIRMRLKRARMTEQKRK